MDINQSTIMYFSPTGSTQKIVEEVALASRLNYKETDITLSDVPRNEYLFGVNDFLILGFPVYSGRVPETLRERMRALSGDNTPVAFVATYGNRDYDDALLEMHTLLSSKGFKVIAAATFVAQHSIVPSIAAGRPDEEDMNAAREFGRRLVARAKEITDVSALPELRLKGNFPYREYKGIPFKPHGTKACIACGLCPDVCPVNAIPLDNTLVTNKELCISCMRCICICPLKARTLRWHERFLAKMALAGKCKVKKMPEYFGV